jgi:hypothetical protein
MLLYENLETFPLHRHVLRLGGFEFFVDVTPDG